MNSLKTLDDVLSALVNLGYKVSYSHETGLITLNRKCSIGVRVKDLKDDKKEFTELEKVRTEYLRFFIINDFWEVREIDRPNGQTLINMIDELDV